MTELKRSLPLYLGLGYPLKDQVKDIKSRGLFDHPNPGLYFDKFIDTWAIDGDKNPKQAPSSKKNDSQKSKQDSARAFYEEFKDFYNRSKTTLAEPLRGYHQRREFLHAALFQGTDLPAEDYLMDFRSDWRFISGLGSGHPFETGFIWHRTLGVPYLPGSSVKGMIRAWAVQWQDEGDEADRLLGPDGEDKPNAAAGRIIIFDALPERPPSIELDIINSHYGPYYQDSTKPPAD